jgi:hypothetical protein
MYVFPPIDVIAIRRISQSGEKCELQMVMRVDEPWHEEEPTKIDGK